MLLMLNLLQVLAIITYGRVLNLPYLVGRQVAQGEDLFSTNVLTDAYDGRKVFDEGALQQAVKDFGADNVIDS